VKSNYSIDATRVFVSGVSSGAMMTDVMMAEYPDVFHGGAAFMGVPFTCFSTGAADWTGSSWNSTCSGGTLTKTAQQWGDAVRSAGGAGTRRIQLWHGTADTTLNYANLAEDVKQWTNVAGVSQTPTSTESLANSCTRSHYGNDVEGISCSGAGHSLPLAGQVLIAMQFFGLDKTSPGTNYTLSVAKAGTGAGTVTSSTGGISCGSTCSASIASGTAVTLTATATSPSTFGGWSGACTGTGTCIVTMTAAQTVTATFNGGTGTTYALTVAKTGTGSGTVTSSTGGINCGSTCSANIASGTAVTLTAAAASGSTFGGWSGACTGTGTCIVTMTAAQSVSAAFTGSVVTGNVSINAGGAAAGSFVADTGFSGGTTYTNSNTIDLSQITSSAPPAAVFQSERYGSFTYTITGLAAGSAQTVTLYFAETYWTAAGQRSFNVAINGTSALSAFDIFAAAGGQNKAIARSFSTTASSSGQVVVTFTNGSVDNAKVNGLTVAAGGVGPTTYPLSVSTSGSGTVTGSGISCGSTCTASFASGTAVTLTATPGSGATFSGWGGACAGTSTTCTVTMSAAQSVTATFSGSPPPTTPCANPVTFTNQTGNFNTTGAICLRTSSTVNGWGCSNFTGRTVSVNGGAATATCGAGPFPLAKYTDGYTYFSVSAGTYSYASLYSW